MIWYLTINNEAWGHQGHACDFISNPSTKGCIAQLAKTILHAYKFTFLSGSGEEQDVQTTFETWQVVLNGKWRRRNDSTITIPTIIKFLFCIRQHIKTTRWLQKSIAATESGNTDGAWDVSGRSGIRESSQLTTKTNGLQEWEGQVRDRVHVQLVIRISWLIVRERRNKYWNTDGNHEYA